MAWRARAWNAALGTGLGAALMLSSMPVAAQAVDQRLERIETQLRALQREVFPGGDNRFFEPEITPQTPGQQQPLPSVTTSALTDVLTRLDAIETQLARLTAATEVNENALSSMEARLAALESRGAVASAPAASTPGASATPATTGAASTGVIDVPAGNTQVATAPSAAPTPARVAAVQAIVMPATGDAGEDAYTYGFRLWDAGFFPEAQQQLALYLQQNPNHRMVSFGRNLLGRAFLDAGDARSAATHFFENYQSDPQGARAADSLLYLAQSMITLGDTRRACIALAEFGDTYPALATGRLQSMYDGLTGRVDCN